MWDCRLTCRSLNFAWRFFRSKSGGPAVEGISTPWVDSHWQAFLIISVCFCGFYGLHPWHHYENCILIRNGGVGLTSYKPGPRGHIRAWGQEFPQESIGWLLQCWETELFKRPESRQWRLQAIGPTLRAPKYYKWQIRFHFERSGTMRWECRSDTLRHRSLVPLLQAAPRRPLLMGMYFWWSSTFLRGLLWTSTPGAWGTALDAIETSSLRTDSHNAWNLLLGVSSIAVQKHQLFVIACIAGRCFRSPTWRRRAATGSNRAVAYGTVEKFRNKRLSRAPSRLEGQRRTPVACIVALLCRR